MTVDNLTALNARDDLLAIVANWPHLLGRLRPGGGNAMTGMPRTASTPLPIDVRVSDVMRAIEDRTRHYARVLLEEVAAEHGCDGACHGSLDHRCAGRLCSSVGAEPPIAPERCPTRKDPVGSSAMPTLLADVAERYGHFTHRSDERTALNFCDDAHEMRRMVDGVLADRERAAYLGPCPTEGCDGELYLRPDRDAGTCHVCDVDFTRASQADYLMTALTERLMTVSEITTALHIVMGHEVPFRTVQSWVRRKRLVEQTDGLYRLADAIDLAKGRSGRMTA